MAILTRDQHLFDEGPKRILALDGGGIRGILTIQVLKRIEDIIKARSGRGDDFRLCDYFDLIGGTSTGAIIAAGLAIGLSVDELDSLYKKLGNDIFQDDILRWGILRPKFSVKPLRKALEESFGDIRLGDEEIRTGLAIMLKRLDTGSPWIVHNNPKGRYFPRRDGSQGVANSEYLLREIVRASTAAPHYFEPEVLTVAEDNRGNKVRGAFVDGGVSPHNNPALQLLLLATLEGYGIKWPMGADKLMVVSIGTGSSVLDVDPDSLAKTKDIKLAMTALGSLMDDARILNELLMQWISRSPTAMTIDREIGNLGNDMLGGGPAWITYARYNAEFTTDWLNAHMDQNFNAKAVAKLKEMDEPKNMEVLIEVGKKVAEQVKESHFPVGFDL